MHWIQGNEDKMTKLLEVNNLQISFDTHDGEVQAVRGVSLHIDAGETVAIVGESGCGKSVTAQSLLGLIPKPPGRILSGTALFQNKDLLKASEKELQQIRGKEIGMIFQDPMTSLNPTMSIGKQIMEGIQQHLTLTHADAHQRTLQMMEGVGIKNAAERFHHYPHQFSGGMRQRVVIAIAMACEPKLLIADEPTTALDVTIQGQILDLMKALQNKMGTSILLITHDLGVVAGTCDRIIVMYAGKVVESGSVDDIFYNPQHPYTQALLHAIPRPDALRKRTLTPIVGSPPDLLQPPPGCPFWPRCPYAMRVCQQRMPSLDVVNGVVVNGVDTTNGAHKAACWLQHPHAKASKL